jgi:hypothetical protein
MPTNTLTISETCSQVIRTPGVKITSLDGRTRGRQISFIKYTYSDYTMRRKAEVLKYRNKDDLNTNNKYSYLSKNGYYSQMSLKNFINDKTIECNDKKVSCACSGINGPATPYYLDTDVPYHSSI